MAVYAAEIGRMLDRRIEVVLRLGLKISSNSIGWFLFASQNSEITEIIDGGVRVFSDGRDPKTREPLGATKSDVKRRRRQRDRYLRRRAALVKLLTDAELFPRNSADRKQLLGLDPYELRARALDQAVPLAHFARIIFHINQRRGYLSKGLEDKDSSETGIVKAASARLDKQMAAINARTYGEFHYLRRNRANGVGRAPSARARKSLRNDGSLGDFEFFPERRHFVQEFDVLWKKQSEFHQSTLTPELRRSIETTLFFQRPPTRTVAGKCKLTSEPRLSRAHPLTQRMELLDTINRLRIKSSGSSLQPLTIHQRDAAIRAVECRNIVKKDLKVSYYEISKSVELKKGEKLTSAQGTALSVYLSPVTSLMSELSLFGKRWTEMSCEEQCVVIERLRSVEVEEDIAAMVSWMKDTHNLDDAAANRVVQTKLPSGFSSFGKSATRKILDMMTLSVVSLDEVISDLIADHPSVDGASYKEKLPYYGQALSSVALPGTHEDEDDEISKFGRIPNPTMHIVLNQLRRLINRIIKNYGRPTEIHLELAQDIRWTESRKKIVVATKKKRADQFSDLGKYLEETGITNTGKNRLLLRLWCELKDQDDKAWCPYSGQSIGASMVFGGSCSVSHILPYSRTLDDGYSNRVLCIAEFARDKGSMTPWEAWSETQSWPQIVANLDHLSPGKRWRFGSDVIEKGADVDSLEERLLKAGGHTARVFREYLATLYSSKADSCPVHVLTGQLTGLLRRRWDLNSSELLERPSSQTVESTIDDDYRTHAIAAAVVGATDKKLIGRIKTASAQNERAGFSVPPKNIQPPWNGFCRDIMSHVRSMVVSHRSDHGFERQIDKRQKHCSTTGKLHGDTAYGLAGDGSVVHRKPLLSLTARDIELTSRGSNIRDPYLRGLLVDVTKGHKGKEFRRSLAIFSSSKNLPSGLSNPYFGIRRVRLKEQRTVIRLSDPIGNTYKGVASGSNHSYEIWVLPDGAIVAYVVSVFAVNQRCEAKPHPAAKRLQRFHKGDLVELQDSKFGPLIARIEKFDENGTIEMVPHNEANASERYRNRGEDVFIRLRLGSLLKFRARRVFVDEIGNVIGRSRAWPK